MNKTFSFHFFQLVFWGVFVNDDDNLFGKFIEHLIIKQFGNVMLIM
jgi:hypothetical protein